MRSISTEVVASGPKRDSRGRCVSDQARRAELLAAYDRSGLTQKAFAQREGVNVHTFVSWLQRKRPASDLPGRRYSRLKRCLNGAH